MNKAIEALEGIKSQVQTDIRGLESLIPQKESELADLRKRHEEKLALYSDLKDLCALSAKKPEPAKTEEPPNKPVETPSAVVAKGSRK